MIRIDYSYTNYSDLFKHLSRVLRLKIKDNVGILPADIGEGTIKLICLANGLELMLFDYILKKDIVYHRKKSNKNFYVIRIDELADKKDSIKSALVFTHINNEFFFMAPANTQLKNMHILISEDWLYKHLIAETKGEIFISSILFNNTLYHYEIFDSEYRRLLHDVMQIQAVPEFKNFIIHNRIMLIIERFFFRYYQKISQTSKPIKASADELLRLKNVETEMLKDFSYTPPNINQLSRLAAMSPSKLKFIFKEVFGMPVYQYYQKHRLQKGKAMLVTRKYSIKEVASELGYTHLKDFSKAFNKHFDQSPEELI